MADVSGTSNGVGTRGTASGQGSRSRGQRAAAAAKEQGQDLAQEAAGQAQRTGARATEKGQQVASAAAGQAQQLAGTVRAEAARVTEEVSLQVQSLAGETREQLEAQAYEATQRLAGGFRQLGQEAQALAEGRPADAPNLRPYVQQAADRFHTTASGLTDLAATIDERGLEGLAEDAQAFARRRPAAFLMGAAAAGFLIGRMVRAGAISTGGNGASAPPTGSGRTPGALPPGTPRPYSTVGR